jgi:hypothetical protein
VIILTQVTVCSVEALNQRTHAVFLPYCIFIDNVFLI